MMMMLTINYFISSSSIDHDAIALNLIPPDGACNLEENA
jgi:hypothetical protein